MKLQRSALDHILSQLDKPDATHCWSREDIDAAREELRDLRHEAYMSRCRGDVLAEINDQLRSEVDTRNITIDHLAAENAAMREALGRIVRCVHGTEIVRDTLPAGYGVSSDEVGSPGPWYGLRLESGEERGWSRSYFKMRLADVGAYEPDADFLASIARAALAEKEDRRG